MSSGEHILRSLIRIVAILLAFKVLMPGVWRHILEFVH